jgi:hypothetical protein
LKLIGVVDVAESMKTPLGQFRKFLWALIFFNGRIKLNPRKHKLYNPRPF